MGNRLQRGFTIPELLIATAVFSVVLVAAMTVFFTIGHLFFKGVTITQTQQAAKKVLDSISSDIGDSTNVGAPTASAKPGVNWLCIDSARYTYTKKQVDLDQHDYTDKFGLYRETTRPGTACSDPFGAGGTAINANNDAEELLSNKMRLSNLAVSCNQTLCDLDVVVSYGDDDLFNNAALAVPACKPGLTSSQFCAVTNLSTSVSQGF